MNLEIKNGEPEKDDMLLISKGMLSHHAVMGHARNIQTITILLRDDKNVLQGCAIMSQNWNGMEVKTLWVNEIYRGKGIGRKLMEAAESEAIKRKCDFIYTNTFSWQAPKFYEKLGYSEYGKLEGFPANSHLTYYSKRL